MGGVDIKGTNWPGYQAGARFLQEASRRCGIAQNMTHAGYNRLDEVRTRQIKPQSMERLARGELAGAKDATSVLLEGGRAQAGKASGEIGFGGETGAIRCRRGPVGPIPAPGPPWRFSADFIFPLDEDPVLLASDLLAMAVTILGAEYGYHFIRDAECGADLYTHGISAPLGYSPLAQEQRHEVANWADAVSDGTIWSGPHPLIRDLFQVNLLSERHMATPVDGLCLRDWIVAALGRGRSDDLGQGRWLWTLTDAEMVYVRPRLNDAGLLLSCLPRVYRDLP